MLEQPVPPTPSSGGMNRLVDRRGAMPELIVDGVTGFLCDTNDDMVETVGKLEQIDPKACRQHALENFSATAMYRRHMELLDLAGLGENW